MGTDIHMYCEEYSPQLNTWLSRDWYEINQYEEEPEFVVKQLIWQRDYDMFAALCGIRDYEQNNPKISKPKGLPEDCNKYIQAEAKRWGIDGHSHSYVSLQEVMDFNTEFNSVTRAGLVSKEQEYKLKEGITPDSWCQGSSNSDLVWAEWTEEGNPLQELETLMKERLQDNKYGRFSQLNKEHFRIVFWFDN